MAPQKLTRAPQDLESVMNGQFQANKALNMVEDIIRFHESSRHGLLISW
jgi:hypothetical protein